MHWMAGFLLSHSLRLATATKSSGLGSLHLPTTLPGGGATAPFRNQLLRVVDTISVVAAPFALLGIVWGGLLLTMVFHTDNAAEQGRTIIKASVGFLLLIIFSRLLINAIFGS